MFLYILVIKIPDAIKLKFSSKELWEWVWDCDASIINQQNIFGLNLSLCYVPVYEFCTNIWDWQCVCVHLEFICWLIKDMLELYFYFI